MKRLLHIVALLILSVQAPSLSNGLTVSLGSTAPRFSLQRLGEPMQRVNLRQLADSARHAADTSFGRPVLLSFWSIHCVSCRLELPRLNSWAAARPDVVFLPVLVDADAEPGIRLLDQLGVTARGLHDRYQVVGRNYGVCVDGRCTLPSLVGVTPDGRVAWATQGYRSEDPLEAQLDSALGVSAPP